MSLTSLFLWILLKNWTSSDRLVCEVQHINRMNVSMLVIKGHSLAFTRGVGAPSCPIRSGIALATSAKRKIISS